MSAMQALAGEAELWWCVPVNEEDRYREAGAEHIVTGHPGQFEKMNEVLDQFGSEWVVFSDDDCKRVMILNSFGDLEPITLDQVARHLIKLGEWRRDGYVACGMTTNKRFLSHTITSWGQTANSLCAIVPGTEVRFRLGLGVATDIDFAAQMHERYGRICRPNYIMAEYPRNDGPSHWRASHASDRGLLYGPIVARYPHLFRGWKRNGGIIYRRQPG